MSEALATQLDRAHARISVLEARERAYRARLKIQEGTEAQPHRNDPAKTDQTLLEELAGALQLASIAELALSAASAFDDTVKARSAETPLPGSATQQPRQRANDLRRDVAEALGRFEWSSENDWRRKPHPNSGGDTVRCRNRDCPHLDLNLPYSRTARGGKKVFNEHCPGCGWPYSKANLVKGES